MNNHNDDFIDKLDYLKDLYVKSREAIVLLETKNKDQSAYLGPHNEFRNALDHIMRMIDGKDVPAVYGKEFRGAESHLLRAGYDAYELLCMDQILYIKNILNKFSPDSISIAFSDYFKVIRPAIVDIERKTSNLREKKGTENSNGHDVFQYYFEAAEKLISFVKELDAHIDIIVECDNRRALEEADKQKPSRWGLYVGIGGVALAIISLIIAFL